MSKFYKFVKAESGSELILEGVIASESWYDDEVSPKQFREELKQHSGDITVRLSVLVSTSIIIIRTRQSSLRAWRSER